MPESNFTESLQLNLNQKLIHIYWEIWHTLLGTVTNYLVNITHYLLIFILGIGYVLQKSKQCFLTVYFNINWKLLHRTKDTEIIRLCPQNTLHPKKKKKRLLKSTAEYKTISQWHVKMLFCFLTRPLLLHKEKYNVNKERWLKGASTLFFLCCFKEAKWNANLQMCLHQK